MARSQRNGGRAADGDAAPIARPRLDPARVPFERTATYRRYGLHVDPDTYGGQHLYTRALIEEQGFDGLPHVVSAAELDVYIRAGEVELFRGIGGEHAAVYAEQLRTGPLWVGRGGSGGGIYTAGGPEARRHAADYAQDPGSVIVRMALKAGARVGAFGTLEAARVRQEAALIARGGATGERTAAALARVSALSVYAVYLGYDGVVDRAEQTWTIFNRTALRIQREDLRP